MSNFSTDCSLLVSRVNTLTADGGTEYLKALNIADELIKTSTAQKKSVILFSDGQPNDNKNNIFTKAAEMGKTYSMYSVGLMSGYSSDDSYREILINVAGSEKRYFEAEDINGLLQAFLNLSKDMGRQEKTNIEILRHNVRHDLNEDYVTFTKGSIEEIELTVLPGLELGDYGYVSILRNGEQVLYNENGRFVLSPGTLFEPGDILYAATYDNNGNELERKRLGIVIVDVYTITYLMNDGAGTVYREDQVVGGNEIIEPEVPEREGYRFLGWYTTQDGAGFDFFSMYNSFNRMKIESNLKLYAHWAEANNTLTLSKDIWNFGNYTSVFQSTDYEISSGDYSRLLDSTDNFITRQMLKQSKEDAWGGSCFGMSSSVVLNRQGRINITEFDPTSLYVRQASMVANGAGDLDVGNVESMINFYQLRQVVGNIHSALGNYDRSNESVNIRNIVNKLRTANAPCVLIINLYSGGQLAGGHAVVAYDYADQPNGTSTFKVYDCSMGPDKIYPITVSNNNGTYVADLGSWASDWGYTIFLRSAMNEEELISEDILTEPSFSFQPLRASNGLTVFIETDYGDYVISDGTDSATIKNGVKISGDLELTGYGLTSEVDAPKIYETELELDGAKTYTITPDSGSDANKTRIFCYDEEDGFVINATADAPGSIKFDSVGNAETSFAAATAQQISVGTAKATTTWYNVDVLATSTGLKLAPSADRVVITSAQPVKADITVSSDFNEYTFKDVDISNTESIVMEESGKTVIKSGSDTKGSAEFGYSVVFDSRLGTSIEPITGISKGSTIEEPNDPQRAGFLFTGWYKDAECKELWDFTNDKVNNDTILYAGWQLDENYFLIVNFRIKGDEAQPLYVQKGTKLVPESCPVNEDGTALTWYSDEACTVPWDFDTVLERNTEVYSPEWNSGRKTEGDVPANEIPEQGIPDGIWVGGLTVPEYTGSAVKPAFHVYDGSALLVADKDYTVSFKNNVNAYSAEDFGKLSAAELKKAPQIVIAMKGNYTGMKTVYFNILQKNINGKDFSLSQHSSVYSGSEQKPVATGIKLSFNGKALKYGKDYTVEYDPAADYKGAAGEDKDYMIFVKGLNNFSGTRDLVYTIYGTSNSKSLPQLMLTDKSINTVSIPAQPYIGRNYTMSDLKDKKGNALTVLTRNGKALVEGVDYKAVFTSAKNPGKATISFVGLGGVSEDSETAYIGTKTVTFSITGTPISKATVVGLEKGGYEFTGQAIKPEVYLKDISDSDYSVKYEKNVNAGTASIIFTGKNGYTGTKKVTFKIKKHTINDNNTKINNGVTVSVPYEAGGAKPSVTVTCGGVTLKAGTDYTISYANNKKAATYSSRKAPVIKIKGKGNYAGSTSAKFTIASSSMANNVTVTAKDVVYNSKAGKFAIKPVVKDKNGATLKYKKDYSASFSYYEVTVNSSGSESISSLNVKKSAPEAGTRIRVRISGIGGYTGYASADYYVINADKDFTKAKIKITDQAYTGQNIEITDASQFSQLTDAKGNALIFTPADDTDKDDFEVVGYVNNKNKGKAQVILKGTGDGVTGYSGTQTVTFNIGTRSLLDFWKGWFSKSSD